MARTALVTGGTRGIGAEISRALREAGRAVVATYLCNDKAAREFSNETGIKVYKFDVCSFDECKEGVQRIVADVGPIEILVNNAGITRDGTLQKMDRDMWDAVIDTNLGSCYNLCKLTFQDMRERKLRGLASQSTRLRRVTSIPKWYAPCRPTCSKRSSLAYR
jgi:acetoacetyl-CoA reductase